jgi:hypothetical protein
MKNITLLIAIVITFTAITYGQESDINKISRGDVVIDKKKPTVYLCLEKALEKSDRASEVSVRVINNTVWALQFITDRQGSPVEILKLSNGSIAPLLKDKAVFFPKYAFQKNNHAEVTDSGHGDTGTVSYLGSGRYATFKAAGKYLDSGLLFLDYHYEWEAIGVLGAESHSPLHRVYLEVNDSSCDEW